MLINGSLTHIPKANDEYNALKYMLTVFSAENCSQRKIYWYEYTWGRTVIRHVTKTSGRKRKNDDALVTIINRPPDIDAIRLVIASHNARQVMTGIRWELYDAFDFEHSHPVESGRFDHFDLLARSKKENVERLIQTGICSISYNPLDWDYDGMLQAHTCPICGERIIAKDTVAFYPDWMECECGFVGKEIEPFSKYGESGSYDSLHAQEQIRIHANGMFARVRHRKHGLLSAHSRLPDRLGAISMVDVFVTPVACWLIRNNYLSPHFYDLGARQAILDCLPLTMMWLLTVEHLRKYFQGLVEYYFDSKIQELKKRPLMDIPKPKGISAKEFEIQKKLLKESWTEEDKRLKTQMLHDIDAMGKYVDWVHEMLGRKKGEILQFDNGYYNNVMMAMQRFPELLSDLVEFAGKELEKT